MLYPLIGISVIIAYVLYVSKKSNTGEDFSLKQILLNVRNSYYRFWTSSFIGQGILLGVSTFLKNKDRLDIKSEIKIINLVLGLAALICLVLSKSVIGMLIGIGLTCSLLYFKGVRLRQSEHKKVIRQLPDTFREMGMMLASGKTLMQACSYVAEHAEGVVAQSFGACAISMQLGENREQALKTLTSTLNVESLKLVTCSIEVSQLTGAPLQDLLYKAAILLEDQEQISEYINVKTAQTQASVKVVVLLPIIIVVGLAFLSPEFREGLMSKTGLISLVIAALLDATAITIIRKLMRDVELDVIS